MCLFPATAGTHFISRSGRSTRRLLPLAYNTLTDT